MNIASEPVHSSLTQRIAKVRNCMLIELSTGVSSTDKDLFVSLCQTYEQNSVKTSCTASASSQNAAYQTFSISDLTSENILPHGLAALSGGDTSSKQCRAGFSITAWSHLVDWDDFSDWNPRG